MTWRPIDDKPWYEPVNLLTHIWWVKEKGSQTNWMNETRPGPWFNIKMTSYQYRKSHCGDNTILRPSYLHNGISYTGKTASLYWIRALFPPLQVSSVRLPWWVPGAWRWCTPWLGRPATNWMSPMYSSEWALRDSLTLWGWDKMATISRRHFQIYFPEWKCINFD